MLGHLFAQRHIYKSTQQVNTLCVTLTSNMSSFIKKQFLKDKVTSALKSMHLLIFASSKLIATSLILRYYLCASVCWDVGSVTPTLTLRDWHLRVCLWPQGSCWELLLVLLCSFEAPELSHEDEETQHGAAPGIDCSCERRLFSAQIGLLGHKLHLLSLNFKNI